MAADGREGRLTPCPRCGYGDSVLAVPAAYAAARSAEAAARVVRDGEATIARRRAARAVIDAAPLVVSARELAMAPANLSPALGCGVVFFSVVAVGALAIYQFA